ncbi:hypothetical protein CRUP_034266 [Coryphaenoides rupestris]|nr:hypothetical protein CRUP_034266 [Coryphaenoides rupestris]
MEGGRMEDGGCVRHVYTHTTTTTTTTTITATTQSRTMLPSARTTRSLLHRDGDTFACLVVLWLVPPLWFPASVSGSPSGCPAGCVCASDVVSCSGGERSRWPGDVPGYATHLDLSHNRLASLPANWSAPRPLRRLATLLLARNAIAAVEADAFALTPHLVHLDLSSNRLAALGAAAFGSGALARLEVLLLFGNRIAAAEPGALAGLRSLRTLYLSGNRLAAFPLELYEGRPRRRTTPTDAGSDDLGPLLLLDLSSNSLTRLPVQSLLALDERQQGGIYLQGNPLECDGALVALLELWCWRGYRPLVDFWGEYPCGLSGGGAAGTGGGGGGGGAGSCRDTPERRYSVVSGGAVYRIEPGDWLTVPCPGSAPPPPPHPGNQTVFWLTPGEVLNSSSSSSAVAGGDEGGDRGDGGRLRVLPGGALEIRGAVAADSGAYTCVAARGHRPDPGGHGEVRVLVGNDSGGGGGGYGGGGVGRRGAEHFNTAFTTLASCVVSIVLVLLYLYLTPCRCRGDRGRGGGGRRRSGEGVRGAGRPALLGPRGQGGGVGGGGGDGLPPGRGGATGRGWCSWTTETGKGPRVLRRPRRASP